MSVVKPFTIIYNLISRGTKTILCDFSHYTGNFQQISIKILEFVKKGRKGKIIYDNKSIFYYEEKSDIIYLTLVQGDFDNMKDEHFFSLLIDIQNSFKERYTLREIFQSYAYQLKDFSRLIQPIVNFYEEKVNYIKQGCLNNEDNQRIEVIKENIDDLINNQNSGIPWTYVELTVNKIQKNTNVESNSEEKMESEMSVKFQRIKEKKERKRKNKYILFGILLILIIIIIILFLNL
jgi:predicted nucleic acid-binding Zn ribbon protein